jgi:uncharacterized protein YyaL (SSP411 family)
MNDAGNPDKHPAGLETRLRQAELDKAGQYDKRTEHLGADGKAVFVNRLVLEDSPYLLQHAHNPVNWYPWGDEAFAAARDEDKPIFLSIGYSTCHWCHVMEVESFDDVEVADLLNQHFISIKMDREQYPDLDEIYMTGVQLVSGHGGWPMSSFLMPDGRPFFGATYFPKSGFMDLLNKVASVWSGKREELEESARSVDEAIKRLLADRQPEAALAPDLAQTMVGAVLDREDRTLGGLAGAPKFPQEPILLFLLDHAERLQEGDHQQSGAWDFVRRALDGMAAGGIYDQVGGGFHRYSVDSQWLVPHFEKMLYNQSQLGLVYLRAWLHSGDDYYRRVLEQTLDYVTREMQCPEGGFYSATDADSEGAEGTFFVWTLDELRTALDPQQFAFAEQVFVLSERGNFEGANVLSLKDRLPTLAEDLGDDFYARLDQLRCSLYGHREQREHPLRDDKLIVAWNGAMIHTLALAGFHCARRDWLQAAEQAAQRILENNRNPDGSLLRINLNGTSSIPAQLEDYANLIAALISLYDVSGTAQWLEQAASLSEQVLGDFYEADAARLYLGPAQQQGPMLVRSSNAGDGATLSPVGTMLANLRQLAARLCGLNGQAQQDSTALRFTEARNRLLAALSSEVNNQALGHTSVLREFGWQSDALPEGIGYAAGGLARLVCRSDVERENDGSVKALAIEIVLAPGWHITAEGGNDDSFQSLAVSVSAGCGWQLDGVDLPAANDLVELGDSSGVAAYGDRLELQLRLQPATEAVPASLPATVQVSLQLCEPGRCLLPETVLLRA